MTRTVLLAHSSAGAYGADRQLGLIAKGLDPARYRPIVALAHDGPLAVELRDAGIETHLLELAVLRRELLSPAGLGGLAMRRRRAARQLAALAQRNRAALIHSNTSVTLAGAPAASLAGVPHVWHVREIYPHPPVLWPALRRTLLGADRLLCVSQAVRAQFADRPAVRLLHDGLAPPDRTGVPVALEVPAGATVCAVLGRISAWKGQEILIKALAVLDGVVAVIAGDAWPGQEARERELRELAAQLGVADRVVFTGFVTDPTTIYARADLVVVPSTRPDPLPNAALEAAAAGCCVIASAHGGLPEIIRDGTTGLLVAPGDAGALAGAIGELAADPARRARLGAAARTDVTTRFALHRLLDGLQALYDEL